MCILGLKNICSTKKKRTTEDISSVRIKLARLQTDIIVIVIGRELWVYVFVDPDPTKVKILDPGQGLDGLAAP